MRFDLHCHVKGGFIDSRVTLERFIELLQIQDFDGMMITDHDSYRACRYWDRIKDDTKYKDFVVLRGIEYDTRDLITSFEKNVNTNKLVIEIGRASCRERV